MRHRIVFISCLSGTRCLYVNSFEIFDESRPDYRGDNRHIGNLSMKLRAKERFRFIENWGLQMPNLI